jgi:LacI family transcriptional regulator
MRALLEHGVDALFAGSDVIALGAIRAIHERGFSIPQDISLIGFDDISLAAMTTPALTTVRQRADQLGVHATQALIDLVEGRLDKRLELVLPVQLVIRETCAPVMERR